MGVLLPDVLFIVVFDNETMTDQKLNALGAQQRRVLGVVWSRNGATIQEVLGKLNALSDSPALAYTTVVRRCRNSKKPVG